MNMFSSGIKANIDTYVSLQLLLIKSASNTNDTTLSGMVRNYGNRSDSTITIGTSLTASVVLQNWTISISSRAGDTITVDGHLSVLACIITCASKSCAFSSSSHLQLLAGSSLTAKSSFSNSGSMYLSSDSRLIIDQFNFSGTITGSGTIDLSRFGDHYIGGTIVGADASEPIIINMNQEAAMRPNEFTGKLENVRLIDKYTSVRLYSV